MNSIGPTGDSRILQIHPTRRCNLRCLHCYSSSGPDKAGELAIELLEPAVTDAAEEGYTVVSVSGGEPLLYSSLRELLTHARSLGMRTTVTTNGMLLDGRRLERLEGVTDLIAISLDGIPQSHNHMRGSDRAFAKMSERLEGLRETGIPFGFIFTLTQHNLHELDWVATFAREEGARLLQIHPLEEVGRAERELPEQRPDELEASFAYLEVARIQKQLEGNMRLHFDFVSRSALHESPARVYADEGARYDDLPLGRIVTPLVLEPDGTVVPLEYGFARRYALGNLHAASLTDLSATWRRQTLAPFLEMCHTVYDDTVNANDTPFFNWYEAVYRRSFETA